MTTTKTKKTTKKNVEKNDVKKNAINIVDQKTITTIDQYNDIYLLSHIFVNNEYITIAKYRDILLSRLTITQKSNDHARSKSIRGALRKICMHDGAQRNKNYYCRFRKMTIIISK